MRFRLVYRGKLPAASSNDARAKDKHIIRKVLSRQLEELWEKHPGLEHLRSPVGFWDVQEKMSNVTGMPSVREQLGALYNRCGHRFVPLVGEWSHTVCDLDILFLRRDVPGSLIHGGGDLDNRLKVLFDALRIPDDCSGVTKPEEGEDPFYVLAQDDKLITGIQLTTDVLLSPKEDSEAVNDVLLVIKVIVRQTKLIGLNPYPSPFPLV